MRRGRSPPVGLPALLAATRARRSKQPTAHWDLDRADGPLEQRLELLEHAAGRHKGDGIRPWPHAPRHAQPSALKQVARSLSGGLKFDYIQTDTGLPLSRARPSPARAHLQAPTSNLRPHHLAVAPSSSHRPGLSPFPTYLSTLHGPRSIRACCSYLPRDLCSSNTCSH